MWARVECGVPAAPLSTARARGAGWSSGRAASGKQCGSAGEPSPPARLAARCGLARWGLRGRGGPAARRPQLLAAAACSSGNVKRGRRQDGAQCTRCPRASTRGRVDADSLSHDKTPLASSPRARALAPRAHAPARAWARRPSWRRRRRRWPAAWPPSPSCWRSPWPPAARAAWAEVTCLTASGSMGLGPLSPASDLHHDTLSMATPALPLTASRASLAAVSACLARVSASWRACGQREAAATPHTPSFCRAASPPARQPVACAGAKGGRAHAHPLDGLHAELQLCRGLGQKVGLLLGQLRGRLGAHARRLGLHLRPHLRLDGRLGARRSRLQPRLHVRVCAATASPVNVGTGRTARKARQRRQGALEGGMRAFRTFASAALRVSSASMRLRTSSSSFLSRSSSALRAAASRRIWTRSCV